MGNAINLTWKDIDMSAGMVVVKQEKTGNMVKIPICSKLMEVLRFKLRFRVLGDDRLFHVTIRAFQKAWKRARAKAGYEWARPHDMRHFFCSFLLNKGVDHMTVAELSGHKSVNLLKERYGHYDEETLKKAISVFEGCPQMTTNSHGHVG
ncbi:MAG: site-specific integrase [Nitrospinae bacterium]|nr:site-specific integrase [Nitrospinota bacterium]